MIQIKNISINNETLGNLLIGQKIKFYDLTIISQELENELKDRGIIVSQTITETGIKLSKINRLILDKSDFKVYSKISYIDYFSVSQTVKDILRDKGFEADVLLNNIEIEEYY